MWSLFVKSVLGAICADEMQYGNFLFGRLKASKITVTVPRTRINLLDVLLFIKNDAPASPVHKAPTTSPSMLFQV
jgi:hypothetical protein